MYIKLTNGQPEKYSIGQLRRDNPQVSFPKSISDATLAEYGVFPLQPTEYPTVDYTKNVVEGTPTLSNGVWTQAWNVVDATEEELSQRTLEASLSVRSQRDYLLKETDWVVVKAYESNDSISVEWLTYRQALRDITTQAGFPHSVEWPTKP